MSGRDIYSLKQAASVVEQLRRENNTPRSKISQTVNDIIR